jgi:outer membrane protein TolC
MGANADEEWVLRPPVPVDGTMYFLDDAGLLGWLNTPERVAQFREFSALKALDAAPELHELDNAIAAQRLVIAQKRRGGYVPVVNFNAGYDRVLNRHFVDSDSSAALEAAGFPVSKNDPSDNEWQFNITAAVPIWEGGGRKHEVAAEEAELDRFELSRVKVAQQIERRALAAVFALQSSQPKIGLARIAADRSERSLKIISDKYQRGATQIIDVLDAQNQALRAGVGAAVAQTSYLLDLVEYQRAIGWFEKFQSPESRAAWINHFKRFIGQQQPADADHKH